MRTARARRRGSTRRIRARRACWTTTPAMRASCAACNSSRSPACSKATRKSQATPFSSCAKLRRNRNRCSSRNRGLPARRACCSIPRASVKPFPSISFGPRRTAGSLQSQPRRAAVNRRRFASSIPRGDCSAKRLDPRAAVRRARHLLGTRTVAALRMGAFPRTDRNSEYGSTITQSARRKVQIDFCSARFHRLRSINC